MIDRYGRLSNTVSRKLFVKTAVLVYTADLPVKVTNRAAYTSVTYLSRGTFTLETLVKARRLLSYEVVLVVEDGQSNIRELVQLWRLRL
ncbi:hypothetical protein B484DRAFT_417177 [Ochromonadaceae sp. CCMP2298]|nr:hypothetical protein B484DRAFT_417177 [Ochromonadaceae sp. CCMP2298]